MLPIGYVLNRDKSGDDSDDGEEKQTLEEKIEEERAALSFDTLTPVTKETFMEWKRVRAERKHNELADRIKAEEAKGKTKGSMNFMSGRALFTFDPTLFTDD